MVRVRRKGPIPKTHDPKWPSIIRERIHYDAETGVLYLKSTGKPVGRKDRNGYIVLKLSGVSFRAHRIAWLLYYGEWPKQEVDHINRIRHDNRICNLRDVSPAENWHNSGNCGVYYTDERRLKRRCPRG